MKKVFLTLAMAFFAVAANAQVVVSCNWGFFSGSEKNVFNNDVIYTAGPQKYTDFNINLKGGYMLSEKMQVGLVVGFGSSKVITETSTGITPTTVDVTNTRNTSSFMFGVYGRYNCLKLGKFNFFNEAQLDIANGKGHVKNVAGAVTVEGVSPKTSTFEIFMVPGLNYSVNEHISLDLYLDFLNLGFRNTKTTAADAANPNKYDEGNYDVDRDFGIAINNGIDGNAFLGTIRLGFNFAF